MNPRLQTGPTSGTRAARFLCATRSMFMGGGIPGMGRALGDLIVITLFVCAAVLFLSGNGSIGNSDIQPYPY